MRRKRRGGARRTRRALPLLIGLLAASLALAGCFGQGIHRVASPLTATQMPPGLWRSLGGPGCTWARIGSGDAGIVGRNLVTDGPQYLQVASSDLGIAIGNCAPFWQQSGGLARPLAQPGSSFGPGDFLVGYEVAPGTYVATPPPGQVCTWSVVSGWQGLNGWGFSPDFVRGAKTDETTSVIIRAGDVGFTSQGCGQWQPTTAAPESGLPINGRIEDFPDPFVLRVDDPGECGGAPSCYFAYSTESGFLGLTNVPVARSTDLVTWNWAAPLGTSDAMPHLAPWVSFGAGWAPSVIKIDDQYVMYYTAKRASTGQQCIGIATSGSPGGPFTDSSAGPATCAGAGDRIDADAFRDPTSGSLYLSYADNDGIRSRELSPNGLSFASSGPGALLLAPGAPWERGRVEAPTLVRASSTGPLFLLYSGSDFDRPSYAVGVARCATPLGPCTRASSSPMLASGPGLMAPGGQTPFQASDGSWSLAFHAWSSVIGYPNGGIRTLRIAPLTFTSGLPAIG